MQVWEYERCEHIHRLRQVNIDSFRADDIALLICSRIITHPMYIAYEMLFQVLREKQS